MIMTSAGEAVSEELLHNYFKRLVNHFFKILPMRENAEAALNERMKENCHRLNTDNPDVSLPVYIRHLQLELFGCQKFVPELATNASFLSLLNILQYLIDNPDCSVKTVKREVFSAIALCNKLKAYYFEGGA